MRCLVGLFMVAVASPVLGGQLPAPLVTGLKNPVAAVVGPDARLYITISGEKGKEDSGSVMVVDKGKAVPFAAGLDDPSGIVVFQHWLIVLDKKGLTRIDRRGKKEPLNFLSAFPYQPSSLTDLAIDPESGMLYVTDSGDPRGGGGSVFRVTPLGLVDTILDFRVWARMHRPSGLVLDGAAHVLQGDSVTGTLYRIKLADRTQEIVAAGLGGVNGLAWDMHGRLYIADAKSGRILAIPRPGLPPVLVTSGFQAPTHLCLDATLKNIMVVDSRAGTITALPASVPGYEVDESPLPIETAVAFPDLKWAGWKGESDRGRLTPLRPIALTHAGDGSNRIFVATEQGVIHVFPNEQKATNTQVFLDIQDRVKYDDNENEEGLLGFAFHPEFKKNGEFFLFYSPKRARLHNVVSRFRVRADDPSRADPASEEEIFRIKKPFWNHDGGTICFGPDGYLYIALGDGGNFNDPFQNGQNLKVLLGKVLRIDVNHKDPGLAYAIPKDNPFVSRPGARPEIWAYGLRNIWRMAFDRQTGHLWASDVGQNLYEEIDLLRAGGNYGWNVREGLHPFGARGVGTRPDLIDPIWEYHHDVGKSLTGGAVYRGSRLPELDGAYLYGDYVSGKIWALNYSAEKKRVVANRPIRDRNVPIMSFGEDEKGEVYFMSYTTSGQGLYWFTLAGKAKGS